MGQNITIGDPPISLLMVRSSRARRYGIRVSSIDGTARLTIPANGKERDALKFAASKENWLREAMAGKTAKIVVTPGTAIPIGGRIVRIEMKEGRGFELSDETLRVPGSEATCGPRVAQFLKTQARDALAQASDHFANMIGQEITQIRLRDTRSRWGSCAQGGRLMYSWRLIMAPVEVLRYVAAHEVAHMRQMNHSDRFWREVAALMPDYHRHKNWLRDNGADLHRIEFTQ